MLIEQVLLLEWLVDSCKHYNFEINLISNENDEKNLFSERFDKMACMFSSLLEKFMKFRAST